MWHGVFAQRGGPNLKFISCRTTGCCQTYHFLLQISLQNTWRHCSSQASWSLLSSTVHLLHCVAGRLRTSCRYPPRVVHSMEESTESTESRKVVTRSNKRRKVEHPQSKCRYYFTESSVVLCVRFASTICVVDVHFLLHFELWSNVCNTLLSHELCASVVYLSFFSAFLYPFYQMILDSFLLLLWLLFLLVWTAIIIVLLLL